MKLMELPTLLQVLERLSLEDIRSSAAAIHDHLAAAPGEIAWWQATMGIDRVLARTARSRQAAAAARAATSAIWLAAGRHGAQRSDPDVAFLARAAAGVARGLVAGEDGPAHAARLLQMWGPALVVDAGDGPGDAGA
jgi:hypothetical protein